MINQRKPFAVVWELNGCLFEKGTFAPIKNNIQRLKRQQRIGITSFVVTDMPETMRAFLTLLLNANDIYPDALLLTNDKLSMMLLTIDQHFEIKWLYDCDKDFLTDMYNMGYRYTMYCNGFWDKPKPYFVKSDK